MILARKDLFYVSVLYLIIFLSYNIYHRSAEDKAGKFYNFLKGMYGPGVIEADAFDYALGDFTENNFEKVEGKCTFDLGVDLTCPLVNDSAENCTYTVKAVKLDSNTIKLEYPSFGPLLAVKN